MPNSKKLSLLAAIFINLNVMIGTGIFINTYNLSASTGAAGFLLYPLVGLCMLPLITITGKLLGYFPTGGLYAFGSSYNPFLGFLSCWSYFFGKLASCAVMLSVGATMLQKLIPGAQNLNITSLCLMILVLFTLLNLQNMKTGIIIQGFFLTAKSIPILLTILAGIVYFDTSTISAQQFIWHNMPMNIPLVLYCLAGFETACALGRTIENASVNGPKAVYYSFSIIMILYGIFQGCIYMNTHDLLATMSGYQGIFPVIAHKLFTNSMIAQKMSLVLNFAIGSSALGGAYGILFANSWNLFTIAENNHIPGSSFIRQLSQYNTPWVAVLSESLICAMFLLCNQTSLLSLQSTASLGIVISYTISAFAYYQLLKKNGANLKEFLIAGAAFFTCTLFVASCALNFFKTGIMPLLLFIAILVVGTALFTYQNRPNKA